jgi:hypothetical protein
MLVERRQPDRPASHQPATSLSDQPDRPASQTSQPDQPAPSLLDQKIRQQTLCYQSLFPINLWYKDRSMVMNTDTDPTDVACKECAVEFTTFKSYIHHLLSKECAKVAERKLQVTDLLSAVLILCCAYLVQNMHSCLIYLFPRPVNQQKSQYC